MVPQQKYQPTQWVKYKLGKSQGISKIVGAMFMNNIWMYTVLHPVTQEPTIVVKESDVVMAIEP